MLTATGKVIRQGEDKERPVRTIIYIPVDVARDSSFPFPRDTRVKVEIDAESRRLIISKACSNSRILRSRRNK